MAKQLISFVLFGAFLLSMSCREPEAEVAERLSLWLNQTPTLPATAKLEYTPTDCQPKQFTNDPLFSYQWHLQNTGQAQFASIHPAGTPGEDINVLPVWRDKITGNKVLVSVIDDGIFLDHEDLLPNVTMGSYNFLSNTNFLPLGNPGGANSNHGTAVAGIILARNDNKLGVSGVAPCAHLIGFNYLSAPTDVHLTLSLAENREIAISNNSWGAVDETGLYYPAPSVFYESIDVGLTRGRNGRGTLYVFAAGNGSGRFQSEAEVDNSNLDGYASHIGTIVVAGALNNGKRAIYSEKGANLLVTGYTGRDGELNTAITTTDAVGLQNDLGYNPGAGTTALPDTSSYNYRDKKYTSTFNGTSAATPMVAGVVALLLEKYPNLTWRDIRKILASSARKNDSSDMGWLTTGSSPSYQFNLKYGFGMVDATAALARASTWTSLGGSSSLKKWETTLTPNTSLSSSSRVSVEIPVASSGISKIEFMELYVTSTHPDSGELSMFLQSPNSGMEIEIYEPHLCYSAPNKTLPVIECGAMSSQRFGINTFLDYPANGTWKLNILDILDNAKTGTISSLRLVIYGS